MNPAKLKVVELRAELAARGLDTKGNKAVLVERLQEALNNESGHENSESEVTKDDNDDTDLGSATEVEDSFTEKSAETIETPKSEPPPPVVDKPNEKMEEESVGDDEKETPETVEPMEVGGESVKHDVEQPPVQEAQTTKESVEVDQMDTSRPEAEKTNGLKDIDSREKPNVKVEHGRGSSRDRDHRDDRKRRRSPSPRPREAPPAKPIREDEPEIKDELPLLSWYDSDLNLRIDKQKFLSASPLTDSGFAYIWAGVRATHGYTKGKICYQVRVKELIEVPQLEDEVNPNVLRLGWSVFSSSLQLGEEPLSYGYGGTGKFSVNSKFSDYGKQFGLNDVVTAYLEYTDSEAVLSYALNDEDLGVAIKIPLQELDGQALAPHILTKNTSFIVNFGKSTEEEKAVPEVKPEKEEAPAEAEPEPEVKTETAEAAPDNEVKTEVKEEKSENPTVGNADSGDVKDKPEIVWPNVLKGFLFPVQIPIEDVVHGPKRPAVRSDCEMIMMCGLPGCGKTTWANKHAAEHREKRFNILGTNALIDRMRVMGLPRKANYHGRWDVLIEKCTKCLQRLMDIGCHRRRNYILDQTNVFPAAQRRKMRNFDGFIRKAVVIVPSDDEFKTRIEKREKEEGKDVPESAVMEMKANFTLPDKGLFNEVIFTELDENEAKSLIQKYNKEAMAAGFHRKSGSGWSAPHSKRFRGDYHHSSGRHDNMRRGPPPPMGGPGNFRRGPPGGGPGPGPNRGGFPPRPSDRWRDNRNHGGGGGGGGGYRHGGDRPGWRGGGGGNQRGPRDFDRGPRNFDRSPRPNPRSSGPPPGYNSPRDQRGGKNRNDKGPGAPVSGGQWSGYGQGQGGPSGSNSSWGQGQGQPGWGQQQSNWANHQQWKGYGGQSQGGNSYNPLGGYGQVSYTGGQYNNWQYGQYGGGYGQGWSQQQNTDGSYPASGYPANWQQQGWYTAQPQSSSNTSTPQPPPPK